MRWSQYLVFAAILVLPNAAEARLECGSWQSDYITLHSRILVGHLPPQYVVFVAVESGLADNLLGIVTGELEYLLQP